MSSTHSDTVELAMQLMGCQSITPEDAGCQDILIARLEKIGFQVTRLPFGEVQNFWAQRGTGAPLLVFAGHTDVVPPGPLDAWSSDPFQPTVRDGKLYGRGAADMKGSLAAMVTACENFVAANANYKGSIGFLITSDEEGPAINGTVKVVEWLKQQQIKINYCIVGEPSSSKRVGDVIKNGRRGSLGATLTIMGIQGHVAYPQQARNPIHQALPALAELTQIEWDQGNEFFPATSLQISNMYSGTGATNVIPGDAKVLFNFRFSTEVTAEALQQRTEEILIKHQLDYKIEWHLSGQPFLTPKGKLVEAVTEAIKEITGKPPQLSTAGGTSDGRFIAPMGVEVVELGPVNASIHRVDEFIDTDQLNYLKSIYSKILLEIYISAKAHQP